MLIPSRLIIGCSSEFMKETSCLLLKFFRDFDHKHHGVFGLVAEGFPDSINGVLVSHSLQGNAVNRDQLKSSLKSQE